MSDRSGDIFVTQGSDVAVHLVWSDDQGEAMEVNTPARAEVRDSKDFLLVAFDDGSDPQTQAVITCSPSSGVIQLTAPRSVTASWTPGKYKIDVFGTITDAGPPFDVSGQYRPAFRGWFNVITAQTTGAP